MRPVILFWLCCLVVGAENETTDGYRGIWYSIGEGRDGPKYSGGLGTYPANMVPMAAYDAAVETTFFVYGGTTASSPKDLQIMIGSYHHPSGLVSRPTIIRDSGGFEDAHANPSIVLAPDGHILVASATRHSFPGRIYRSRHPRDPRSFDIVHQGDVIAYPQVWHHAHTGFTMLHTRYVSGQRFLYSRNSRDGRSWTESVPFATFDGHYQNSASFPDGSIGTVFNYHPRGSDSRTDIFFLRTADGGRSWKTVEGQAIAVPLMSPDNPARILDVDEESLIYLMDLAFDDRGRPLVLYLLSRSSRPGSPHRRAWHVRHWTGICWTDLEVTAVDHNYDVACLLVDGKTWMVVGPSGPGPQPGMTGGEVVAWQSRDQGRTWRRQELTRNSVRNHTYVRRAIPRADGFVAFWADGDAASPGESNLYFLNAQGVVHRLPRMMTSDTARPQVVGKD